MSEPALVLPKPIPDLDLPVDRQIGGASKAKPWSLIITKLDFPHLSAASEFTATKASDWILLWAPEVTQKQAALLEVALQTVSARSKGKRAKIWVFTDKGVPNRILNAFKDEVAESTIADAKVEDGVLEILTCAFEVIRVEFSKAVALAKVKGEDREQFELDPWGNYISWPDLGLDLDVHSLKFEADPKYRAAYLLQVARSNERLGAALKRMREEAGIRQAGFPALTDREIRRIESGEIAPKLPTYRRLAEGYGMDVDQFLNKLSEVLSYFPKKFSA